MQFGQRDVGGRGERGEGGDQPQLADLAAQSQRDGEAQVAGAGLGVREVALQFRDQLFLLRIRAEAQPIAQRHGDMAAPLGQVEHPLRHAVRVQREPAHVHRRAQQFRRAVLGEQAEGRVGVDQDAVPGHDDRRVRQVPAQHGAQRRPHRLEARCVQAGFVERGGVSGREQQCIALAQRQPERLGEPDHHRAPGDDGMPTPAKSVAAAAFNARITLRHFRDGNPFGNVVVTL